MTVNFSSGLDSEGKVMYAAEFTVTGDFNLYLERSIGGKGDIKQRQNSNQKYSSSDLTKFINWSQSEINTDITTPVYPKQIKLISYSPVVKCEVTYNV